LLVVEAVPPAGGAETQILLIARALARRGVRACLIVFDLPDLSVPRSFEGVAVSVRPLYRSHQRLGKLREVISIARAIAKVDAQVLVVRMESPEVGVAALFAKLLGRRFVYSSASLSDFLPDARVERSSILSRSAGPGTSSSRVPDVDLSRLSRKPRDWRMFRFGVRLADEIVVQTEEQAQLCEAHLGRTPILIRSIAELASQPRTHPDAFLWIGRVVQSKRPDAFVELARSLPDADFWMVAVPASDRADDADLMRSVQFSAGAVPNLTLLPARPRGQLMNLVNRAVAIVSTSDFEGMPNTFLEGWARGVPALALAHDPDGVIERYALGGFAHGSPEALLDLARQLWERRTDRVELASRCRQYIIAHHSPEVVGARWQDALGISTSQPSNDGRLPSDRR
jgi:glycosyltransferase involved in cell wall biosynthesis